MHTSNDAHLTLTTATLHHLDELLILEQHCFVTDQLSRRSFRRFITSEQAVFLVSLKNNMVIGYALTLFHKGTRLARLYSIAISPEFRGLGIARQLMNSAEDKAIDKGAIYFRLEVNTQNTAAINLYHSLGFKEFKLLKAYYQDLSDALRMQKRIRYYQHAAVHTPIPWLKQNTPFTCGPASLMMALAAVDKNYQVNIEDELEIWREATTIFMTSGHGGCHPLGLALAANTRGVRSEVWINSNEPLFVDGVRSDFKKDIITTVHHHFVKQCHEQKITVHYENISAQHIKDACNVGAIPIVLISTYRMDSQKAPHWVVVSGYDERCFYLHDPDADYDDRDTTDGQYMPITHEDFEKMSSFGSNRTRTALLISAT